MDSRKNIVLTGGNTGIGLETAKALFGEGHNIIFGSRNEQRNAEAVNSILASFPISKGSIKSLKVDLSKRASIQYFVQQVKKSFSHIDILINNAGMFMNDRQLSQFGVEMTMTVNYFGPFYLTYLLFQNIKKSKEGRIINVASGLHAKFKRSTSQDLALENGFGTFDAYAKSKLAIVQFSWGLAQRLSKYPHIKAFSLHPGVAATDLFSTIGCCNMSKLITCLCCCCFVLPQAGARTNLYLSREPFPKLRNGEYYDSDTSLGYVNPLGYNIEHVEKLWRVSEEVLKIEFRP